MEPIADLFLRSLEKQRRRSIAPLTIPWGSPVPFFGNIKDSVVATVGINPSDREFLDVQGNELSDASRRFHTLRSLGLRRWRDASPAQLEEAVSACSGYFHKNPYDKWFRPLDRLIAGTGASFYNGSACHLDLVPFATHTKWGALNRSQQKMLLEECAELVQLALQASKVRVLILNGKTVVSAFEQMFKIAWISENVAGWSLTRPSERSVTGRSFSATVSREPLSGIGDIAVLGYNHNIQSSFGVTKSVTDAIGKWIRSEYLEVPSWRGSSEMT